MDPRGKGKTNRDQPIGPIGSMDRYNLPIHELVDFCGDLVGKFTRQPWIRHGYVT